VNFKNLIGARTLKTGLAVTISATLALTPLIASPFYAILGTIFAMQNTVSNSFKLGKGRVYGTMVGAAIGFVFAYFSLTDPPFIGIAMMCVIIACGALKLNHSIFITFTLCASIMLNQREGSLIIYTLHRSLDTALGVVVGVIVNYFIIPPNHLYELATRMEKIKKLTINALDDEDLLITLRNDFATLSTFYRNFTLDKKYDRHSVSYSELSVTMEGIQDLYFHVKSLHYFEGDTHAELTDYHTGKIKGTLQMIDKTVADLKAEMKSKS